MFRKGSARGKLVVLLAVTTLVSLLLYYYQATMPAPRTEPQALPKAGTGDIKTYLPGILTSGPAGKPAKPTTSPTTPAPTSTTAPAVAAIPITIDINTQQERKEISPYIYGSNSDIKLDNLTFRRLGGNRMTGYNWETNASNAGSDWNHSSDSFMCMVQGLEQCAEVGAVLTTWHDRSIAMGAASEVTLPMAGYVAADMNGSVAESQAAPCVRWRSITFTKGSALDTVPSLTDGTVNVDEEVNFLVNRYGRASTANGVKIYALDNEPELWPHTHPRIHPDPVGAVELVTRSAALAQSIKAVDPSAQVFGYESYGFNGFVSLQDAPDWTSVQGSYGWYIDYYLDQMKKKGEAAGKRLLDGLSLHWYPEAQGGGQRIVFGGAGSVDVQKARVQAPRTLWDPTYQETSWIQKGYSSYLPLIPRLWASINQYYPGTRLAFTEFSYGGEADVSGGLAIADVLGIFGKYGVYAGAYWPVESDQSYIRAAYQLYRDYDGAGSQYGNTFVRAVTSNVADSSAYAAISGSDDKTLHIIVLNKNFDKPADFRFNLAGCPTYRAGEVWAFDAGSAAITQRKPIAGISDNRFNYTLAPRTAAHIVLHAEGEPAYTSVPTAAPTATPPPASSDLLVYGDALVSGWQNWSWGSTVNLASGSPVQTGSKSVAVTYNAGWAALSLHAADAPKTAAYAGISFWVYGAPGNGQVKFSVQAAEGAEPGQAVAFTPAAGQWTEVRATWAQLGNPAQVVRLNWQDATGSAKPAYYIDNVRLIAP